MRLVGLTGGIATGKSTVSQILRSENVPVIDSDRIAHQLVAKGTPTYRKIIETFGSSILRHPSGDIDRRKLGRLVFNDEEKRTILERLTHPPIRRQLAKEIAWCWITGEQLVVLDVPLLIESGMHKRVNYCIVVVCDHETQLDRLMARDSDLSLEDARARIASQLPIEEKVRYADFLLDNNGTREEIRRRTLEVIESLQPKLAHTFVWWVMPLTVVGLAASAASYCVAKHLYSRL